LDIGCGTGRHLSRLLASGRVWAVDADLDAVSTARFLLGPEGNRVHFVVGRAEGLPFPAEAFEEVHCLDVLHWAPDAATFEAMWREAWRVLRPGGLFVARFRQESAGAKPDASDQTGWFLADQPLIEGLIGAVNAKRASLPGGPSDAVALRKS
jgi:SAM-dependent methyltransferase